MARYRFHCTNGLQCVFDPVGVEVRAPGRLSVRARAVAERVKETLRDCTDWSEWHVTVHDLKGRRVLLQPFPADGTVRAAA